MPALKRYIKNEYKNWTNQANTLKQQQQQDDTNDSYKIMTAPKKYTIINGATKINPAYNKGTNQSTMPQQRQQQENTEETFKIMIIPRHQNHDNSQEKKYIIINGVTKKKSCIQRMAESNRKYAPATAAPRKTYCIEG
uniref:Uncharacterized protein n=1 Tax=Ditylum brightwellii TaxID=49249 RepID=A0A7S4SCS7_9STRA